MTSLKRKTSPGFMRQEDGNVSIEFVFWLPILVFVLALTADVSLIFGAKAQVLRVIQDANRAAAVGRLRTVAETENYVRTNIGRFADQAVITSVVQDGVVSTTVIIPSSRLIATGLFGRMSGLNVTINAQHMLEA